MSPQDIQREEATNKHDKHCQVISLLIAHVSYEYWHKENKKDAGAERAVL